MGGIPRHWRIWFIVGLIIFYSVLLVSEYLDLPYLLFGVKHDEPNPAHLIIEGLVVLLAAFVGWNLVGRFESRMNSSLEALHRLASQDDLTGIPNRRRSLERLSTEFERSLRFSRPLSIAIIDLDGFKSINDTQGHLAGDQTLVNFTKVVTRHVRSQDFFGRLGGDEFLVIFIETGTREGAAILERVREQCALAYTSASAQGTAPVTLSAGITSPLPNDTSMTDCLRRADEGLIRAKTNGRNRIELA